MKEIGIYLGSFNPVHMGHLMIANSIINKTELDEVWMVLSPLSPDKVKSAVSDLHRFEMLKIALKNVNYIKASDIELNLPLPSFTINTVQFLKNKFPKLTFSLIIGQDNANSFKNWKNVHHLYDFFKNIYVYPRLNNETTAIDNDKLTLLDLPIVQVSSTKIRENIELGLKIDFLVLPKVKEYIIKHKLYLLDK